MKVTLESTPEIARANGLPVRLWSGTTERGSPVLALITRLAVPDDAHPDDIAQVERELTEPPTRVVDPSGGRVESPRFCSTCLGRGDRRPAVQVARDAGGLEWFECGQHSSTDNLAGTERLTIESLDGWFERHELPTPGRDRAPSDPRGEPPWLVKDFWVLYSAARQLNEALATAVHETTTPEGDVEPSLAVVRAHQGLAMQLERLAPAFDFCEGERRGEPPPSPAADVAAWRSGLVTAAEAAVVTPAELLSRARARCSRPDLFSVRAIVTAWQHSDDLTLIGPGAVARMILGALDALAIVHGAEAEAEAAELDAFVASTQGDAGTLPRAPRALTDADREALAALHRWLHHPRGDAELIEAAAAFHEQIEHELPGECERLDAEIGIEQRAERDEAELSTRVRDVFRRVGVSLDVPAHELIGGIHEGCTPETHWPPPPHAALIIRTIVDDARVSGSGVAELDAARFLAEALRGARMGWHGRRKHASELDRLVEASAPKDEPARTPWLFGFHVATTAEPGAGSPDPADVIALATAAAGAEVAFATCRDCGCTDLDCSGCIEKTGAPCHWVEPDLCSACAPERATGAGPLEVTEAMREYYRDELCYRAPETLNERERRIIAAVEAEERQRATEPDTWIEGKAGDS